MTDREHARAIRGLAAGPDPAGRLLLWSRLWSPLVPDGWRERAWRELELPGSWAEAEAEFWATFEVGLPVAPVPLLLHAALGTVGANAREDWMRVLGHLGLEWTEHRLAPDHLAAACEVVAFACARGEMVLVRELVARYLEPWCGVAAERLERDAPLAHLPERFAADLRELQAAVAASA